MPGPAPKHPSVRARRNNPKKDFRTLPSAGRKGRAPKWPLPADLLLTAQLESARDRIVRLQVDAESGAPAAARKAKQELAKTELVAAHLQLQLEQAVDAEKSLWGELWKTPQAVLWEEAHAQREVAQYVRWKIRAEQGDIKAAGEARQLSDRLGLNPLALLRLRAEVERVDEAEEKGKRRRSTPARQQRDDDDGDPRAVLSVV